MNKYDALKLTPSESTALENRLRIGQRGAFQGISVREVAQMIADTAGGGLKESDFLAPFTPSRQADIKSAVRMLTA